MAIIGGQCLTAIDTRSGTQLSSSVGIVIVALLAMVISFCGFRVLHGYERYASIPSIVAIIITVCLGKDGFTNQAQSKVTSSSPVLSFGMAIAAYEIPWSCLASDFTTYLDPKIPSLVSRMR